MMMRMGGVLMSFDCMLMGGLVITVCMMFCRCVVGLRGMLVMLRRLLMCVMGHRSPRVKRH